MQIRFSHNKTSQTSAGYLTTWGCEELGKVCQLEVQEDGAEAQGSTKPAQTRCAATARFLDNDQLDAHFLYFTVRPLQSFTCFKNYMIIIRGLNCIDAASGIVLSVSGRPVHRLRVLFQLVQLTATD